jgi:leader peptidase (prepilin peptidase)/N-methyltransferase
VVELLTAVLFGWIAWEFGAGLDQASLLIVCAYSTLASLLVVATFVDLEHFIIPDEVSLGGVALGLMWSLVVPLMHVEASALGGAVAGLVGGVSGYGILWLVVEAGRLAFGRRRLRFAIPAEVEWVRSGEQACLRVDGESMEWSEFFFRGTESLEMRAVDGDCDGGKLDEGLWKWSLNSLQVGAQRFDLNSISRISARIVELVIPREVMGFGDVKLLAAIGAFLGWRGVLFALFAGATVGSIVGVFGALMGRREWSARIPFGPYLALGAMLWLAAGPACLRWYWEVLGALLPKTV